MMIDYIKYLHTLMDAENLRENKLMKNLDESIHNYSSVSKTRYFKFSALQFAFWAMLAVYYPFFVVFLKEAGYSNTNIGIITSVNSVTIVISQPFWGMISDKMRSVKKVFVFCMLAAGLSMLPLPFINSFLLMCICFAVITFFESPGSPLLDSWIVSASRNESFGYGHVRLWGSIGYAVFVWIFGMLFEVIDVSLMFPIFLVMALVTVFLTRFIKSDKPVNTVNIKDIKVGRLFKNFKYISFLIFALFLFIPNKAAYTYLPNLIESVGGSREQLGIASAVMAIFEVPVFFYSKQLLRRYSSVTLLLASAGVFILKQFLFTIVKTPIHIILIQPLQGLYYGLFLGAAVYYIDTLAPDELKSTSQTVASGFFVGLGGIIGNYGGGLIIDILGIHKIYSWGLIICILGTLFFVLTLLWQKVIKR